MMRKNRGRLDIGADGVMLPMVSTVEEAKHIVKSAKYYPEGMRGVAIGLAQDRFRTSPPASKSLMRSPRSTGSTSCGSDIGTSASP